MSGTHHCRNLALALHPIGQFACERPDAAASRKGKRASHCILAKFGIDRFAIRFLDAVMAQGLRDTARAHSAPCQRRCTRLGKGAIVDITPFGKAFRKHSGNIARILAVPAALEDLARQIGRQPAPCGCEAFDITEREPLESGLVQCGAGS